MISSNNPWRLLREQLMQIEDIMIPSAPFGKDEKSKRNLAYDNHWIEFDVDVFMDECNGKKSGCWMTIEQFKNTIFINQIDNSDGSIHRFDVILSLNDMNFANLSKATAQSVLHAHRGKLISMHIRRLQPSCLETIEFHFPKNRLISSHPLGFTLRDTLGKNNDPGLFVIGIKTNGQAANHGRLRIGDRLMQISNTHVNINLQCIGMEKALKLIHRIINESKSVTLVVAHQTEN